jgi:hypothetical protein
MAKFKWFYICHLHFAICHLKFLVQAGESTVKESKTG